MMAQKLAAQDHKKTKPLSIREARHLKRIAGVLLDLAIGVLILGFLLIELILTDDAYDCISLISFICIAIGFILIIIYLLLYRRLRKTL